MEGCGEIMIMCRIFLFYRIWQKFLFVHFKLSNSDQFSTIGSKIQGSPCVISNFDALCYNIEPKVDKEISLNFLENMLLLFIKVHVFSFARDVKEKSKARIKRPKSRSLRKEIKKSSSSKNLDQ